MVPDDAQAQDQPGRAVRRACRGQAEAQAGHQGDRLGAKRPVLPLPDADQPECVAPPRAFSPSAAAAAAHRLRPFPVIAAEPAVCATCRADPGPTAVALYERLSTAEARQRATQLVCASCSAAPAAAPVACVSTDCPTLYKRVRADKTCETLRGVPAFVAALDRPFAAEAEVIDLT